MVDYVFISVQVSLFTQSAEGVEYTRCPRQQRSKTSPNECPKYDTKQSDGEVSEMLELLGYAEYPFIAITRRSTLARSSSTWLGPIHGLSKSK